MRLNIRLPKTEFKLKINNKIREGIEKSIMDRLDKYEIGNYDEAFEQLDKIDAEIEQCHEVRDAHHTGITKGIWIGGAVAIGTMVITDIVFNKLNN